MSAVMGAGRGGSVAKTMFGGGLGAQQLLITDEIDWSQAEAMLAIEGLRGFWVGSDLGRGVSLGWGRMVQEGCLGTGRRN